AAVVGAVFVTVGGDTDWAATMGKLAGLLVWVSDVVVTVRVPVPPVGAGDSLVTPSSSTVTGVLAAMVLAEPSEQIAMLSVAPRPQFPRDAPPPTVMLLLTSLRTLVLPGRVMVIWLCALPDIPPPL